jgi:hypothetical protein
MARISGLSRPTVYTGVHELDDPPDPHGRVCRPGGGPKRLTKRQPSLLSALDALVDPDTRGDPESPLRWTSKSTRELADALGAQGFQVSDDTVGRLLRQQRDTLQRTQKTKEGAPHPSPGFLLDKGRCTTFDVPDARVGTSPLGINNRAEIVGSYSDPADGGRRPAL